MARGSIPVTLLCGALLLAALPTAAGDKPWKPISVAWYGQSFFIVTTSKGTRVAIDPHLIPEYGRFMGLKADVILLSHNHNDHTQVTALENAKQTRIVPGLSGPGLRADWNAVDETVGDVRIRTVGVYHDTAEGMTRGKVGAFVIEADGWRIAHLGDLGHELTPAQVRKFGPIDVLMVPVGGVYTLNGSEAKAVVAQLKPREYIFPMHYGTKVYEDLLPITEFLEDQDREKVAVSNDNRVTLNKDPQRPRPLIVQLHYWPKAGGARK